MAEEKEEKEEVKEEAAGAAGKKPGEMSEAELRAELEKHFREQKVSEVLMQFMVSLSTLAYTKMGLTEDTEYVRDLDQARLAIDSFKALLDAAGGSLGQQDVQALAGALASMQMTFAREAGGAEQAAPAAGEKEPEEKKSGPDVTDRLWVPGKQ